MAVFMLPLLLSCQKEEPSITFDVYQLEMDDSGGSQTVSLTTNYSWTATASDPWLQLSPASGDRGTTTLTIRAEANNQSTTRKGTVTVTCRELIRGLTVSQIPQLSQTLVIKHTNNVFPLPSFTGSSMVGIVKWGDGSEETYNSSLKHTYSSAGNHTVEINAVGAYSFKLESVAGVTEIDFGKF